MSSSASNAQGRIDSWKGVAAFLRRDERTVQRWEKERGLPVYRVPGKRGAVFTYESELQDWLRSAPADAAEQDIAPVDPNSPAAEPSLRTIATTPSEPVDSSEYPLARHRSTLWRAAAAAALAGALAAVLCSRAATLRSLHRRQQALDTTAAAPAAPPSYTPRRPRRTRHVPRRCLRLEPAHAGWVWTRR